MIISKKGQYCFKEDSLVQHLHNVVTTVYPNEGIVLIQSCKLDNHNRANKFRLKPGNVRPNPARPQKMVRNHTWPKSAKVIKFKKRIYELYYFFLRNFSLLLLNKL